MVEIARKFHAAGGSVEAIDATPRSESGLQSAKATHEALRAVAAAGGGKVRLPRRHKPDPKHPLGPISDRAAVA